HQRRIGAAHSVDAQDRVRAAAQALSRPHQQQNQRHHLPPLAVPVQPAADSDAGQGTGRAGARQSRNRVAETGARLHSKRALAAIVQDRMGITLNPEAMFDVQVKRIHEYKRQLLNLFHTVALYQAMRADPSTNWVPRVKIFAGKAAASYHSAKLIIKLANDIARTVNNDPTLRGRLKVVFIPNYNV
nr:alpha-1,4 glucan phosphorylase L isozyme, chloroplastic/amyloplastic [Tanacetum cinerariifolium]